MIEVTCLKRKKMITIIVLLVVYVISIFAIKIFRGKYELPLAGRIAMSAMLLLTAIGHFIYADGMAMMLPEFIPYKPEIVFLTGIIEIAAAIGLLLPALKVMTGWLLIVFFIAILPANIYAAINNVDFQKASFDGSGTNYLWFRIPLQIFFIFWVYFSAVRTSVKSV